MCDHLQVPRADRTQTQALAEGYKPVTTQIFDKDSKYLNDDSVFAVKDSLVVEFQPRNAQDGTAELELVYDIQLAPEGSSQQSGPEGGLSTVGIGSSY